jgi:Copper transport outer membrane protein, MctB
MINFRFHIVSLTAVLLALGIGLMLGTTFLDQATVDALRERQETLEADVRRANERAEDQAAVIEANEREADAFYEQIGERLFDGILTDEPVLVIATRGIEQDTVDQVMRSVGEADARLLGTWWFTDRMRLDDDGEVGDMGDALQLSTTDPTRLRAALANQLADVLVTATDAPEEPEPGAGQGQLGTAEDGGEPAVLSRLVDAGFVDYQMPDDSDQEVVTLPTSGLRVVIVSGPDASVPPGELMVPVLIDLSANGPIPAVAVEPSIVVDEQSDENPIESLVIDIRGDEDLTDRVSTVDDIDRAAGLAATVLATQDAIPGAPIVGHYGSGAGARLLPEPPGAGE